MIPVDSGSATLKDAINEALRDWVASVDHTAYLFGTAAGPHPFPSMVRDFARGIGDEARAQCLEQYGVLPDAIAACVGGGSNAIGLFPAFLDDESVAIHGFEPGGEGVDTGRHAATIYAGDSGVLHGARTYVLQDEDGQTIESHSISAGLDYPGVGPQHAHLAKTGRATYTPVTDAEAMDAMALLSRTEGIIPAIESAHAVAGALEVAQRARRREGPRGDGADQPLRPGRQGHGDRARVVRARRGEDRMSVATAFEKAKADGRAALVGYLPAGFPDVQGGIDALRAMVDAGCDVIEIGLPYSDPVMDGPTIQAAAQQALEGGVRTTDVLRTVEAVAATGTPTVVMTYWNPIERYGVERFATDLASAGGAGLITPDLTPDFAPEWIAAADAHDLDKVFLVAPSSTDERIAMTTAACRGFVYATAVMGVTGARTSTSDLAGPLVARTRAVTELPVGVGLGRQQRRPGGRGGGVRRRGDRRLGVRAGAARPPRRPGGRSQGADRAHRGPGRGRACVRPWLRLLALLFVLGACSSEPDGTDVPRQGARRTPTTCRTTALTDTDGQPFSLAADTDKRLTLVFFGYTNCPDICQIVMGAIASAHAPARRGGPRPGRGRLRDHRPGPRHRAGAARLPRPLRPVASSG